MNVLADIISSYRVTGGKIKIKNYEDYKKMIENVKKEIMKEEEENSPQVPSKYFSKEIISAGLMGLMISSIKIYELEYHQFTLDYDTLRHFLEKRLNYLKGDIEHEDFFRDI